MTEEKKIFKLSDVELADPKLRKGYPGRLYTCYPTTENWNRDNPHSNYKRDLTSYYKVGGMKAIRGDLMKVLNEHGNQNISHS